MLHQVVLQFVTLFCGIV